MAAIEPSRLSYFGSAHLVSLSYPANGYHVVITGPVNGDRSTKHIVQQVFAERLIQGLMFHEEAEVDRPKDEVEEEFRVDGALHLSG